MYYVQKFVHEWAAGNASGLVRETTFLRVNRSQANPQAPSYSTTQTNALIQPPKRQNQASLPLQCLLAQQNI